MHLMLQQDTPDDFVVASGESHSVRQFCELAFGQADLDYRDYVVQDDRFYRPAEVESLIGDATRARTILGWTPDYDFESLVKEMVSNDIATIADSSAAASSVQTAPSSKAVTN